MTMWALVPVKDLRGAKHRLSGVLSPAERRALCLAMVGDVLAALADARGLSGLAVVTRDAEAADLARAAGARVLEETQNRGHTAAVVWGAALLEAEGASGILTVPGDVPLLTSAEIEQVVERHAPGPSVTIVPSRDERGSNCIACSPPTVFPVRFGEPSFQPHLEAARRLGMEPTVLRLPGIGLDIDTPQDLADLLARPGAPTRTHRYLSASGVAGRVLASARGR